MAGLPHFSNSQASINKYEPVYLNQFEAMITCPNGVGGGNLLVEHVTKVSGLSVDKNPGLATQKYKFAKRNYAVFEPARDEYSSTSSSGSEHEFDSS